MAHSQPFYRENLAQATSELANARSKVPSVENTHVPRVTQLDATLLDTELENILCEPLLASIHTLRGHGQRSLEPELFACIRFMLLRLSLSQFSSSYGSRMQNLKYRNEFSRTTKNVGKPQQFSPPTNTQINTYILLSVVPHYVFSRAETYMLANGWGGYPKPRSLRALIPPVLNQEGEDPRRAAARKRAWKRVTWEIVKGGERIYSAAKLINLVIFLYNGRYRSVVDRILGLRLIHANQFALRTINYDFLNRQLVWDSFTEFLLFFLPLINVRKSKLWLKRTFRSITSSAEPVDTDTSSSGPGPLVDLPPETCAICYADSLEISRGAMDTADSDPTDPIASTSRMLSTRADGSSSSDSELKTPYVVDCCGAKYCYYCIAGRMLHMKEEEESPWICLRCAGKVLSIKRWTGYDS